MSGRSAVVQRVAAAVVVLTLGVASVACSSDDSDTASTTTTPPVEATCEAWAATTDAFQAFDQIDVVDNGLDSVRTYLDGLGTAVQTLQDAATAQLKPSVDRLQSSLQGLQDALTASPVVAADVRSSLQDIDSAWNSLVTELRTSCPEVTSDTTPM